MSTYYIENGSSGNQYYFDNTAAPSSQTYRTYGSPVTFSTNFTTPTISSRQHDSYGYPQQHQSVAGFSKTTTHQYYATPSPPTPQVRARVRSVGQQDHHSTQAAPQQHHFQFDSRQQPGHPSGPAVVYQTPGAAQYTHRNVDLWTEGSSGGNRDHYVQAQRVSVRSVSTGSPTRPQDSLQHYYSQLTPEQHQQLLQRQQQQQQQQQQQSPRGRVEEQHVSRQVIQQQQPQQQRSPPQEAPASHPVGIRSLMTKFAGPAPKTLLHHPHRSQSTSSRHYSSSSYTSRTTTNATNSSKPLPPMANLPTMTYSALPKAREPPVNSAEYYQMQVQQLGGQGIPNIQQAAAPAHIQHHSPLPQGGQERFRLGSLSDHVPVVHHQPAPPQSPTKSSGNTLSSLRDQYMHQTKETHHEEYSAQPMPPISRTIIGEDVVPTQKAPVSKVFQGPQSNQNNNNNNQVEEATAAAPTNEPTDGQTDA